MGSASMNINGFPVVDDSYRVDQVLDTDEFGTGYVERDYSDYPLGGLKCAMANTTPTFSQAELLERIAEKTAKKSWITDKCDAAGLTVKNQSRSSYCWIHAPVHGMEVQYVLQGGDVKVLSAFYAGARIKNGRNQGGSGITGVKWLHENGTCLESMHAPMDFKVDRNPEHEANAKLHQLVGWEDLDPRDMMAIFSKIVLDQPVTVGIPAWGHEVLITFLVVESGLILPGFDNSWGTSYGKNGRGVLRGKMTRFDEAGSVANVEPAAE